MTTHHDQPVYPNPSVALVVLEVRFPPTTTTPEQAQERLRAELRAEFPLAEQFTEQRLTVTSAGTAPAGARTVSRFGSRDRTSAVAVSTDVLVIETTRYLGFEWYLDFLRGPLAIAIDVLAPDGILALGHRFIDEVRVPDDANPVDWSRWIDGALLAPSALPALAGVAAPEGWQGLINYQTTPESTLGLQYGPAVGTVIAESAAIRRDGATPSGPYFLLDWDSRWTPRAAPEATAETVLTQCRALYEPVRAMYHRLATDDLRRVFASAPTEETP